MSASVVETALDVSAEKSSSSDFSLNFDTKENSVSVDKEELITENADEPAQNIVQEVPASQDVEFSASRAEEELQKDEQLFSDNELKPSNDEVSIDLSEEKEGDALLLSDTPEESESPAEESSLDFSLEDTPSAEAETSSLEPLSEASAEVNIGEASVDEGTQNIFGNDSEEEKSDSSTLFASVSDSSESLNSLDSLDSSDSSMEGGGTFLSSEHSEEFPMTGIPAVDVVETSVSDTEQTPAQEEQVLDLDQMVSKFNGEEVSAEQDPFAPMRMALEAEEQKELAEK